MIMVPVFGAGAGAGIVPVAGAPTGALQPVLQPELQQPLPLQQQELEEQQPCLWPCLTLVWLQQHLLAWPLWQQPLWYDTWWLLQQLELEQQLATCDEQQLLLWQQDL
jgi:hypothetical protein